MTEDELQALPANVDLQTAARAPCLGATPPSYTTSWDVTSATGPTPTASSSDKSLPGPADADATPAA